MKKASKKKRKSPQPIVPLVRGELNAKARGELGELAFVHKAASLGFGVAKPHGDNECYDFILDSGERLWRVQVKSTYCVSGGALGYRVMSRRNHLEPYSDNEIDFLVAHIVPRNLWYVVPVKSVGTRSFIHFHPSGCNQAGGFFESYREAWHLMAAHGPRPSAK